ncbi:MAG: hypothetical protein ACXWE7_12125 [Nitrososphaeraceae archaeon]
MAQGSEIIIEPKNDGKNTNDNDKKEDKEEKLVVISKINLQNIEKKGTLKIVAFINGEEFVKNIPLDKLKESSKQLKVKFSMDKENEIVSASTPDEFFICAYHAKNANDYKIKSISSNKQNAIEYFDCNEGDIKSTTSPTKLNVFKPKSQVYNKTITYYNMYSKPKVVSFATLDNNDKTPTAPTKSTDKISQNLKPDEAKNIKDDNINKPVKVKIIVPMEDRKDAKKIKVMAMLKGQIKSEIVNVQKEFDKIGGYTIERIFAFDRNTDIGPIQIGDRFHACVSGQELNPPEGSECEKKIIKHLDKPNSLAAR